MKLRLPHIGITLRLVLLFSILLAVFTLTNGLLYNSLMQRELISHHSRIMQRSAYAISQNLADLFLPDQQSTLDENRLIVDREMLSPYLNMTEQLTRCNVYLIDREHTVTGVFDGVLQHLPARMLPAYMEQSIALGFMGKTPLIRTAVGDDTHLTACMPIMDEQSRALGVILLEASLRELGYAQVSDSAILLISMLLSGTVSVMIALLFSHLFTRPILSIERIAHDLAEGRYEKRTALAPRSDELGALACSVDVLAARLQAAREADEALKQRQQAFFATVSHELRTPVTVIRGSLEALRDGIIRDPRQVMSYYEQMLRNTTWLQRLIADLLELSRLQDPRFTLECIPVDLTELLGDAAGQAASMCASKGIGFHCSRPDCSLPLHGDPGRLMQMLMAVVDNAVRHTPAGANIFIRVSDVHTLIIEDEGCGIAPEELPHIFDRFRRSRPRDPQSTGLGLAIVQEIASRHGISIRVESTPGKGTCVSFLLPDPPSFP